MALPPSAAKTAALVSSSSVVKRRLRRHLRIQRQLYFPVFSFFFYSDIGGLFIALKLLVSRIFHLLFFDI